MKKLTLEEKYQQALIIIEIARSYIKLCPYDRNAVGEGNIHDSKYRLHIKLDRLCRELGI